MLFLYLGRKFFISLSRAKVRQMQKLKDKPANDSNEISKSSTDSQPKPTSNAGAGNISFPAKSTGNLANTSVTFSSKQSPAVNATTTATTATSTNHSPKAPSSKGTSSNNTSSSSGMEQGSIATGGTNGSANGFKRPSFSSKQSKDSIQSDRENQDSEVQLVTCYSL